MKKVILFSILMIFPFFGCQLRKSISKSDSLKFENKTKSDVSLDSVSVKKRNTNNLQYWENFHQQVNEYNKKSNLEILEIEYDTEKPIDKCTGRPPIKKEINSKLIENEIKKDSQYTELHQLYLCQNEVIDSLRKVLEDKSDYNIKIENESQIKEIKSSDWVRTEIITMMLIIAILFIIVVIKFKK